MNGGSLVNLQSQMTDFIGFKGYYQLIKD